MVTSVLAHHHPTILGDPLDCLEHVLNFSTSDPLERETETRVARAEQFGSLFIMDECILNSAVDIIRHLRAIFLFCEP